MVTIHSAIAKPIHERFDPAAARLEDPPDLFLVGLGDVGYPQRGREVIRHP
jgi:hypothetical protein